MSIIAEEGPYVREVSLEKYFDSSKEFFIQKDGREVKILIDKVYETLSRIKPNPLLDVYISYSYLQKKRSFFNWKGKEEFIKKDCGFYSEDFYSIFYPWGFLNLEDIIQK